MLCLACLKIVFGGCGGDPGEDSQIDPGIVGCSSSKEYLEKSLFPGVDKDLKGGKNQKVDHVKTKVVVLDVSLFKT